jgi:hypothetical protein
MMAATLDAYRVLSCCCFVRRERQGQCRDESNQRALHDAEALSTPRAGTGPSAKPRFRPTTLRHRRRLVVSWLNRG